MQGQIGEIFLHHIAFVAQANHKISDTKMRVAFHDVPQNRLAADLHHGFGTQHGFFAKSGAETAGENDCFHRFSRACSGRNFIRGEGSSGSAGSGNAGAHRTLYGRRIIAGDVITGEK